MTFFTKVNLDLGKLRNRLQHLRNLSYIFTKHYFKRQILGKITIFTQQFVINIGSKILYKITCADKLIKKDLQRPFKSLFIGLAKNRDNLVCITDSN